jgi:hypothetical protein
VAIDKSKKTFTIQLKVKHEHVMVLCFLHRSPPPTSPRPLFPPTPPRLLPHAGPSS